MSLGSWLGRRFGLREGSFWGWWYGGSNWTDEVVTTGSAMHVAAFWACVRLISETIGTLPMVLYRRLDDGSREVARELDLYTILHDQPNDRHTAVELWEGLAMSLCLDGNGYAAIGRRRGGEVESLTLLRPEGMQVQKLADGSLRYRYSWDGLREDFGEEDVLHVRGFGPGEICGLSPVSYARQTLGLSIATDRSAGATFRNGLRPSGVLSMTQFLKPDQRKQAEENIVKPMEGVGSTGKTLILEGGMSFAPLTIKPVDAELLASRSWNVEEVCRWLRTPPVLIGHSAEGQTMWGSGIEQIIIGFQTFTLRPYLTRIEQAVRRRLLSATERVDLYPEFKIEGLLRADSAARADYYSKMAQNGAMTRNEIRSLENLPTVDGGDDLTVQSNLVPLDMLREAASKPVVTVPPGFGGGAPEEDEE